MSRELRLPSLNKVLMAGNLTQDPEVRYTQSGAAVATLRLASNRRYQSGGEWKDDTCFIDVVVWRELAERCGDQLKKGSPVLVEGRLESRNWETKDGQKRTTIEISAFSVQNLEKRGEGSPAYSGGGGFSSGASSPAGAPAGGGDSMETDDLPF
jgi:single-strand DNA-binding protein